MLGLRNFKLDTISAEKKIVIVAKKDEGTRVLEMIKQAVGQVNFIGFVHPDKIYQEKSDEYLGNIVQIGEIAEVYNIDEIIFSTKNLSLHEIINSMALINNPAVDYKIAPEESLFIIGSNSVDNPGDLYTIDINFNISKANNSRNKKILDIALSFIFLLTLPIHLLFISNRIQFIKNIFAVLFQTRSWVGYINTTINNKELPKILKGIIDPSSALKNNLGHDEQTYKRLNLLYAKHYQIEKDLNLIWRGYKNLGNKHE